MTHVVCQPCQDCKYTDCVVVCPVECFWQGDRMLFIDPDTCIDCGECIIECPVNAIYRDSKVPATWQSDIALNQIESARLKADAKNQILSKIKPLLGPGCGKSAP